MPTLGVIGTGHLATYFITALRRGGCKDKILLSPRNAERAAALAKSAGCEIAPSNQAVMAGADIVLLSVRPPHAQSTLEELTWSPSQTALSVMAGIGMAAAQLHITIGIARVPDPHKADLAAVPLGLGLRHHGIQ